LTFFLKTVKLVSSKKKRKRWQLIDIGQTGNETFFCGIKKRRQKKGESKPKNEISSEIVVHCTGFRSPCMFYKRRSSKIA